MPTGVFERTVKMKQNNSKGQEKRFVKMTKKERLKHMTPCIKAGNEANRKKLAKETKRERIERLKPWIKAGQIAAQRANSSSIEKLIWKELDELGIDYKTQVPFNNSRFIVDIYIPAWRLIIECNGTYWHNYELFPESQRRDEALGKYANKNGFKVIWLWESDIRKNSKQCLLQALLIAKGV